MPLTTTFVDGDTITPAWANSVGEAVNALAAATSAGTVTSVSGVTANGFSPAVADASTTPSLTMEVTFTGIAFANGTGLIPAVPSNFPTLNQNTTGSAASATFAQSAGTATYATSAGSATTATSASSATTAGSATTATTASNIAGGSAGQILFQSGNGVTSYLPVPPGAGTYTLTWNGSVFSWQQTSSGSTPYGIYDPRYFITESGSYADGNATATYLAPTDFFNSTRSTNDMGATIYNTTGTYTTQSNTTVTDPFSNTIGAGITVSQSSQTVVTLTTTQMSSATNFAGAVNGAAAGTTFQLPGGTYNWGTSTAYLSMTGSSGNWIRFVPQPGTGAVTIEGSSLGVYQGATYSAIQFGYTTNVNRYISFENIGFSTWTCAFIIQGDGYFRIHGCTITNTGGSGIYIAANSHTPNHYEISNNSITYTNQLFNTAHNSGWGSGLQPGGDYISVFGNTISFSQGEGIANVGFHSWIYGNTVYNCGSPGLYLNGTGLTVWENNFCYNDQANNGTFFNNVPGGSSVHDCIRIADEGQANSFSGTSYTVLQYITIRNNICWGGNNLLAYFNYDTGTAMTHVQWTNNTLFGGQTGTSKALVIDTPNTGTPSAIIVANNICAWSSGTGTNTINDSTGVTFEYQVWYNVTAGSASGTGDQTGTPAFHG